MHETSAQGWDTGKTQRDGMERKAGGRIGMGNTCKFMADSRKTPLLCMQCRGIGPHLVARGKSHGFSRVAAGTWGTFLNYDGDAHSKREFV